MHRPSPGFLPAVLLVVLVNIGSGSPPQPRPPFPQKEIETWETTAREHKLTEPEIKLLREQKFLVAGDALRQVFVPYTMSR